MRGQLELCFGFPMSSFEFWFFEFTMNYELTYLHFSTFSLKIPDLPKEEGQVEGKKTNYRHKHKQDIPSLK